MVETALTQATEWTPAASCPVLGAEDVHVWRWQLAPGSGVLQQLRPLLSTDELQRAHRFHFPRHKDRYIVGRGTLRVILSGYLACDPSELEFEYGTFGKPRLRGCDLQFNLAHSGSYAVLAVSSSDPVGVDLEATHLPDDALALVQRFFARGEAELFRELGPDDRAEAFMNLWTRKEAWLKATGEGISHLLAKVEVTFLPGSEPRLTRIDAPHFHIEDWQLIDLPQWPGYNTALATHSNYGQLRSFSWKHQGS